MTQNILTSAFGSLADEVRKQALAQPHRAALIVDDDAMTYAQFWSAADRIAAGLQRQSVRATSLPARAPTTASSSSRLPSTSASTSISAPASAPASTDIIEHGLVIGICAATSSHYMTVFIAGVHIGATVVPLSPALSDATLAAMIDDAGIDLMFVDNGTIAQIERLPRRAHEIKHINLDADARNGNAQSLADWLPPAGSTARPAELRESSPFNLIYSSGTTGVPKGILQPHGMRWMHVKRAAINGYGTDTVTLLGTPLYSNTTLVSILPTLALGGTAILMRKFDAGHYLALAQRHRATHTMLVPVQYQRILAHEQFEHTDLSSFREKFCTSAPFNAPAKAEVLRRWPGGLTEFYGMTEGGARCELKAHLHPDKLHTVGRPLPDGDMLLLGPDDLPAAPGEMGEVVGRSNAMMTGYHNQPDKTDQAQWFDSAGRRYIRTGDIGRFDEDGFLILLDRKKDMIISGGFNIYPSDIEAVLHTHPDIADVAVVGMPSQTWGETPAAFVQLRPQASVSPDTLLGWANSRLEKMQRIAAVALVDEIPRNAIGKILKRELRDGFVGVL